MKKRNALIFTLLLIIVLAGCTPCECPTQPPPTAIPTTAVPPLTATPVITFTPTPEPCTIDIDNLPPQYTTVKLIADPPIPLREISRFNDSDVPVWGIFGKSISTNRIKINQLGKILVVWKHDNPIKGDGGNFAWEIAHGQQVGETCIYTDSTGTYDGVDISVFSSPNRTRLYILDRHVVER